MRLVQLRRRWRLVVTRAELEAALRRYGDRDELRVLGWFAELAAILTSRWFAR